MKADKVREFVSHKAYCKVYHGFGCSCGAKQALQQLDEITNTLEQWQNKYYREVGKTGELQAKVMELTECLKWYGDEKLYECEGVDPLDAPLICHDNGHRARQATGVG